MAKHLLAFIVVFFALTSLAIADKNDDRAQAGLLAKMQDEYGRDLTHAPFFLRFAYFKEFNKDWKETDYAEREAFLTDYENNLAADEAKYKAEAKVEAAKEKELALEKKEETREARDKLRAQEAQEKADEKEDEERQKEFNATINDQQKELEQMQREETQGNH